MPNALLLTALDHLRIGGFQLGVELDRAHEISQAHEGEPQFDWLHALIHRIEGDDFNADYWYRSAGKTRHSGTVAEEWQIIRSEVENG